MFFGRNDAKAETPVFWPPHAKSWLIGKDSDAGRDWGQEKKGMTVDEMAGWHHQLDGREFEWTPGVSDGQGGLVCCDSWGHKESDTTEQLNWTELMIGEINNNTIKVGDFNTPLTPMERSTKQKISKETQTLNDTIDQLDLIDIYRTFHFTTRNFTFSQVHKKPSPG